MIIRTSTGIILLFLLLHPRATAQDFPLPPPADSLHATLIIHTSPESSWVMIDTALVGRTPCSLTVPAPARFRLRIQSPDASNWLSGTIDDTLEVGPGQTVSRTFVLETWILVATSPMGAEISTEDSLLGTTPLIVRPGMLSPATPLTFRLRGYETATANLAMATDGILRIPLRARPGPDVTFDEPDGAPAHRSRLRLYLTGGGAVLAGAAAAYFKVKADNANNDFILTQNPAFSSDRDRFDTTSGVFLAVTQITLGLFLAFLMSE